MCFSVSYACSMGNYEEFPTLEVSMLYDVNENKIIVVVVRYELFRKLSTTQCWAVHCATTQRGFESQCCGIFAPC